MFQVQLISEPGRPNFMQVDLQKTLEFGDRNYEVALTQLCSSRPPLTSTPFSVLSNIGCGQVGPNGNLSPILYAGMVEKENALKIKNDQLDNYVAVKESDIRHIELQLVTGFGTDPLLFPDGTVVMAMLCFNETYKYFTDHPLFQLSLTRNSNVMGNLNGNKRTKRQLIFDDSDEPSIVIPFEQNEQAVNKKLKKLKTRKTVV